MIEVYLQFFTESVSVRDIGKPTSRAKISSPSPLYFKAVKGAQLGSALVFIGEAASRILVLLLVFFVNIIANVRLTAKYNKTIIIATDTTISVKVDTFILIS